MGEAEYRGVAAAPGLALGRAHDLDRPPMASLERAPAAPAEERALFRQAVHEARTAIEQLATGSERDAVEMLTFQLALLEDDAFIAPVLAAIDTGVSAVKAWRKFLTGEVESYLTAPDEIFAARATDLIDIRDRILLLLSPTTAGTGPELAGSIVLVGSDLPLSRFLETDWSHGGGIVLRCGSQMGHVAMLARGRSIPMVVGVQSLPSEIDGYDVLVDGSDGTVVVEPDPERRCGPSVSRASIHPPVVWTNGRTPDVAVTLDGTRISVMVNVNDIGDLGRADPARCDGIGLVRTEILFHRETGLPSEDEQYAAYQRLVSWAGRRPVTVRTFDAGGDKPFPGFARHVASGSPLGLRGLRLSLREPATLEVQFRALARAATGGKLRVILPMVTVPEELIAARTILDKVMVDLARADVPAAKPPLGMMVEVPAAAITVDLFDDADFFSIGSNDLTQYVMAVGRDVGSVSALADPLSPAVIRLIENVALVGGRSEREVRLCGDAASDVRCIGAMLRAGVRGLSVDSGSIDQVIEAIRAVRLETTASEIGNPHG